jgi:hypothetical protein
MINNIDNKYDHNIALNNSIKNHPIQENTMIRKRKRNEMQELTEMQNINGYTLPQSAKPQEKSQSLHMYYSYACQNYRKFYSIFSQERCVICKEEIEKQTSNEILSCSQCFKYFHNQCLNANNKQSKPDTVCPLCIIQNEGLCILCHKTINSSSDIQVCCELCGNLMHLECLSGISLHFLYKRKFYEENFYQMENNSGQILTQERMNQLSAKF